MHSMQHLFLRWVSLIFGHVVLIGEGCFSENITFKSCDSFPGYIKGHQANTRIFSSFLSWERTWWGNGLQCASSSSHAE